MDPELRRTFDKLGISTQEQQRLTGVAVDAVLDSVSVATTFKKKLAELGIIFCSLVPSARILRRVAKTPGSSPRAPGRTWEGLT